ncbi:RagB/SusD family nutrient uptake outer membrane protein [Hymenobacter rubidus]|uniref:RagB/SusD family nutrient uptake outer membrane protein n=1 Tax=Hymenobacter rubidus TaxID=1441626 RepID=UPI00191FA4DF|nr:RagB/SusD family nutrient uptake outer membrane protein [Hymenobacter rubidus]
MNTKLYAAALAAVLALGTTACQKDPETEPRNLIRDDTEWDAKDRNATVALYFFNDLFNYLPGGFNRIGAFTGPGDFLAAATDDALPSRLNSPAQYFTNGTISVVNNPDAYWSSAYAGIRRVNIFLANIDRVPALPANIVIWKAEARFIRAMLYFELLKRYGGVPLIGDKIFTLDDDLSVPRNTYAETVNYIVSECDLIKPDLRLPSAIPDGEWGRIPRTAAFALKSRLLLYAASPLFNGGQVNGAGDRQGYPTADANRWQLALTAAQDLIALNAHSLIMTPTATAFPSVFTTKKNSEIILAKQASNNTTLENWNAPMGYGAPAASQGLTSPSQNFVDAFPMLSGAAITDAGSGYSAQNPYANRDPRLLFSVFANGVTTGTTTPGSRWLSRNVETFDGGRDRPGGGAVQTRTGYYLRKFLGDFTTATAYSNQSHNFPIFRYAETLLNAAEALNELGRTTEALTLLLPLRQRAGLTPGTNSRYGIPATLSQSDARTFIRNERRIELGFEEHRFWDLRRWKTAENVLNGPLYGVQITKGGTTTAPTYTYTTTTAANMTWQPRLYYMPLPYDETTKNLNLTQNPGW